MNIAFDHAIEEYFKYSKIKLKESTYEEQFLKIKKHIIPFFKNRNIYDINLKDIIKWKEFIELFNFKYNYKSYLYYSLTSIFDFLVKYYNIDKNYAKIEGNFKNDEKEEIGNIWTLKEFKKFIKKVDNIEYNALFNLLYFTGMRKGELLALNWKDIDLKHKKVNINKSITRNHKIQTPKTKSSKRIISINRKTKRKLKKLRKLKNIDDKFIFDISFTQLKRIKDDYCKISNVQQIKIHEFRHSHAVLLYLNGVPIDEISNRLGHSKISVTIDTYLKYLPKKEKRVIKLLNSYRMLF